MQYLRTFRGWEKIRSFYCNLRKENSPRELERKGKMPEGEFHPLMMPFHDYGWSGTLYLEMINCQEWR